MKKLLCFAALAAMLVSCDDGIRDAGHIRYSVVSLVSKDTKEGTMYGLKSGERISLPPQFARIEYGADEYSVYAYPDNSNVCCLFSSEGVEVLTGRQSGSKEIGFAPLMIVVDKEAITWLNDAEYSYFGNIFNCGTYHRYKTVDGRVCALFIEMQTYFPYGPYNDFVPGCSGYMFKDASGKWGAHAVRVRAKTVTTLHKIIPDADIADNRRFDEVIEVVLKEDNHFMWFLRDGQNWSAVEIKGKSYGDFVITDVPVDRKLLNRVSKMPIDDVARGKTEFDILRPQRVGVEGASVVFL